MHNGMRAALVRLVIPTMLAAAWPLTSNVDASPLAASAGAGSDTFAGARALIVDRTESGAVPSVCVAVARDGEIVWEEAFGWADKGNGVAATTRTPYLLASLAKPITATGVMVLVERGAMDLDGRIQDYLGDLALSTRGLSPADVTARHLLNHTSGLPLYYNYFYADQARRPSAFAETVGRYGVFVEPPGRRFRYANLGYDILGHAVATVSGKPHAAFMRDEVFAPLGLADGYVGSPGEGDRAPAVRYGADGGALPTGDMELSAGIPVYASVHDLIRFGMFHLGDRLPDQAALLSEASLDAMHWGKGEDVAYDSETYGLGWFFREDDGGYRTFWHEGGMSGASAMLKLAPDRDVGVALVMNAFDQRLAQRITNEILDVLLPKYARKRRLAAPRSASRFSPFRPGKETTGTWRGQVRTWAGGIPIVMAFEEDGDIHVLTRPFFDHTVIMPGQRLWDSLLNNTGVLGNRIYGWTTLALDTEDTADFPYVAIMDVTREGDVISGAVTAVAAADRMYYSLSSYVRLEKD
ncbi:MAG: beta-lactamase family protein [Candidatus Krumholzibacteriota bacterium]|nr:beta-lactamase family protein [Candidatus Krumholzibacteriota bacterium]